MKVSSGLLIAILIATALCAGAQQKPVVVRVGYFPNITHAQALVGRANGQFEKALGSGAQIEWKLFNAGPSAIEAIFANAIDITYIGPNPAVVGYVRSHGEAVRLIGGSASGGASLWCANLLASRKQRIFTARKSPPPNRVIRRTLPCGPGCAPMGCRRAKKVGTSRFCRFPIRTN